MAMRLLLHSFFNIMSIGNTKKYIYKAQKNVAYFKELWYIKHVVKITITTLRI